MSTFFDYLSSNCNESFEERPFTELDSAILSQLVYLNFQDLVPSIEKKDRKSSVLLTKLKTKTDLLCKVVFENGSISSKAQEELCGAFFNKHNKRFAKTKANYYSAITTKEPAMQFAAIVFFLDHSRAYIAFRGSDGTTVGYKEDLEMSFTEALPGQLTSLDYLNSVMKLIPPRYEIYVGGHSKGGNFALYAAINTPKRNQKRIKYIFEHDDPGFVQNPFSTPEFKNIESKIRRTVPQGSIFGMLLSTYSKFSIVCCPSKSLLRQHSPSEWLVNGKDFKYAKRRTKLSSEVVTSLNDWVLNVDAPARKQFIDVFFGIFSKSDIESVYSLKTDTMQQIIDLFKNYYSISKTDRKLISKSFSVFFRNLIHNTIMKYEGKSKVARFIIRHRIKGNFTDD
jgi:hypothetical protein